MRSRSNILVGRLELIDALHGHHQIDVPLRERFPLGRYDVCTPYKSISNVHFWLCATELEKAFQVVLHNESSNGVWVDGLALKVAGVSAELHDGSSVALPTETKGTWISYRFKLFAVNSIASHYKIEDLIGFGGFGLVHQILSRPSGKLRALKRVQYANALAKMRDDVDSEDPVKREILVLRSLDHSNIIKFFGAYPEFQEFDTTVHIVMEWAPFGDVWEFSQRHGLIGDRQHLLAIARQCVAALTYMHSRGIIHRDIKLVNMLVTRTVPLEIKLGDFGLACKLNRDDKCRGQVGTKFYAAPELIQGEPYGPKVDSFALGVSIFELFCGRRPYEDRYCDFVATVLPDGRPELVDHREFHFRWQLLPHYSRSDPAYDLLHALMQWNHYARPRMLEVATYPWLVRGDSVLHR